MRRRLTRALMALPLALLAACSGGTGSDLSNDGLLLDAVQARFGLGEAADVPDAREVLTPALVSRSPVPLILVVVEDTDIGFSMVPLGANLGTVQWRDAGGGGLLRRGGILVGTRGFGFDLHTADVAPLAAALRRGGASDVERINRYIDGENRIVAVQYLCSVRATGRETLRLPASTHAVTVYDEACIGEGPAFTNRYWVDGSGTVRKSYELIHPRSGAVEISVLAE